MFTKLVCVGTYFKNTKPHWAAQRYLFIYNYISNLRIKLNGIVFVYQRVYSYLDKAWSWVQHDEHGKGFIYFWFLMVPSYDRVGATYWYITIVPLLRHFNTSHRLWLCNLQKYWGLSSPSSAPLSTTVQKQSATAGGDDPRIAWKHVALIILNYAAFAIGSGCNELGGL
jgi:hypothetical protein